MKRKHPHSIPISLPTFEPFSKEEIIELYASAKAIAAQGGINLLKGEKCYRQN